MYLCVSVCVCARLHTYMFACFSVCESISSKVHISVIDESGIDDKAAAHLQWVRSWFPHDSSTHTHTQ